MFTKFNAIVIIEFEKYEYINFVYFNFHKLSNLYYLQIKVDIL